MASERALVPILKLRGKRMSWRSLVKGHAALVHPSFDVDTESLYERQEFLGDRVLGLCMAQILLRAFPEEAEGTVSRHFNMLVSKHILKEVGRREKIFELFSLGRVTISASMMASMCEVVIGILFELKGLEYCLGFIEEKWSFWLQQSSNIPMDYKTLLQEYAAQQGVKLPEYSVLECTGPAHKPHFFVRVNLDGVGFAEGSGLSKRLAEVEAVKALCAKYKVTLQ